MHAPEDHAGFMERFLQIQPTLRSFVFSLVRDMDVTEDLVQEASMALWRDYARYDPTQPFVAWAIGVARNHVARWRRTVARSKIVLSPHIQEQVARTYAEREDELQARRRALARCVARLSPWSREILSLRYDRRCSLARIAEKKSSTLNAINKALGRIRSFLIKCTGGQSAPLEGCEA